MCKYKFKVGDLVRSLDREFTFYGKVGKVTRVDTLYSVLMMHDGNEYSHYEYELELVSAQNSGWMLIDTYDRSSGETVLVYLPDFDEVTTAWYCMETGLWPHDECLSEDGEPCNVGLPTHWMPLPKPPSG